MSLNKLSVSSNKSSLTVRYFVSPLCHRLIGTVLIAFYLAYVAHAHTVFWSLTEKWRPSLVSIICFLAFILVFK